MEGARLPRNAGEAAKREAVFTEWDSEHQGVSVSLRTLYRDGWTITAYGKHPRSMTAAKANSTI